MPLPVPTIAGLDQATVDQFQLQLYQELAEAFPTVDFDRGFVRDVNLHLGAIVTALISEAATLVADSQSLLGIAANPALADPSLVDAVLSNFRLTRQAGLAATGQVTVVLDAPVPVVVPAGAAFSTAAATFAAARAYAVRTSAANVTSAADLVLSPRGDGTFSFAVPVAATAVGAAGMARRGDAMTPSFPLPHFLQAYAEGDFAGGLDPESNAGLLARLQQGIAAPTFSNRVNVAALVQQTPEFRAALQLSIVGAGDAEMLRDKHTIFPLAAGFGRADVYARTAALPLAVALAPVATFLGAVAEGGRSAGLWQFSIGRGDAPGFYEVGRVALPAAPQTDVGFAVVSDTRGVDLSGGGWVPDVDGPLEGAYSPYQTAVIQFHDPTTPTAGLTPGVSTAAYSASAVAMPQLADLQALLGGRQVRGYGGDVLVKAPVPCFLRVSFSVRLPSLATPPDAAAIAAALAALVNSLGYAGRLATSTLAAAVAAFLPPGASTGPIDVLGRLRRPDGTTAWLRDPLASEVVVPSQPASMVTPRTVCFILDPADVAVAVQVVATPDI